MWGYLKAALFCGAASAVLFFTEKIPLAVLGFAFFVSALIFLFMMMMTLGYRKREKPGISGWVLYAFTDMAFTAVVLILALSMKDGQSWGSHAISHFLLWFGLPVHGALLILDIAAYKIYKYKFLDKMSENDARSDTDK